MESLNKFLSPRLPKTSQILNSAGHIFFEGLVRRISFIGICEQPAMLNPDALYELNFQKRKMKDRGSFLMVAAFLDVICIPARL